MPTHTWKDRERQVCKYFGTTRNPLSGGNGKHSRSDSLHDQLFIEHKHTQRDARVKLWKETKELALLEDKIPVLTLSIHGDPGFYVMCHSSDLLAVANQRAKIRRGDNG